MASFLVSQYAVVEILKKEWYLNKEMKLRHIYAILKILQIMPRILSTNLIAYMHIVLSAVSVMHTGKTAG